MPQKRWPGLVAIGLLGACAHKPVAAPVKASAPPPVAPHDCVTPETELAEIRSLRASGALDRALAAAEASYARCASQPATWELAASWDELWVVERAVHFYGQFADKAAADKVIAAARARSPFQRGPNGSEDPAGKRVIAAKAALVDIEGAKQRLEGGQASAGAVELLTRIQEEAKHDEKVDVNERLNELLKGAFDESMAALKAAGEARIAQATAQRKASDLEHKADRLRITMDGKEAPADKLEEAAKAFAESYATYAEPHVLEKQSRVLGALHRAKEAETSLERALAIAGWAAGDGATSHTPRAATLTSHSASVTSLAFSRGARANGTDLAVAGADGKVRVFNADSGRPLYDLKFEGDRAAVAYSPEGTMLAIASSDGKIRIVEPSSGAPIRTFEWPSAHRAVVFSPDGTYLATAGEDGAVRLWSPMTGDKLRVMPTTTPDILSLQVEELASGCGKKSTFGHYRLVATTLGGTVEEWETDSLALATGREAVKSIGVTKASKFGVNAVGLTPNGAEAFTSDRNGDVVAWDACASPWRQTRKLAHHTYWATGAAVNDPWMAFGTNEKGSSGDEPIVGALFLAPNAKVQEVRAAHHGVINAIVARPGVGSSFAVGDRNGTVKVWGPSGEMLKPKTTVTDDREQPMALYALKNGTVGMCARGGTIAEWSLPKIERRVIATVPGDISQCERDRSGARLLSYTGAAALVFSGAGAPLSLGVKDELTWAARFDSTGTKVFTSTNKGKVRLWDVASAKELKVVAPGKADVAIDVLAPSDDGKTLFAAGAESVIHVLDAETLASKGSPLIGHTAEIRALVANGNRLASIQTEGTDTTLRLWDVAAAKETQHARIPGWVGRLAFSPDGRFLVAIGDTTVTVLDGQTLGIVKRIGDLDAAAYAATFAPDGKLLYIGFANGDLGVFDPRSWQRLFSLHGADNEWAAFTPDGHVDASAGGRRLVQWRVGDDWFRDLWSRYNQPGLVAAALAKVQ